MPDLDMQIDSSLLDSEELNLEPEYRCPNCESTYNGYKCSFCGYNNYY